MCTCVDVDVCICMHLSRVISANRLASVSAISFCVKNYNNNKEIILHFTFNFIIKVRRHQLKPALNPSPSKLRLKPLH